jgi:hypothetical protein
MPVMKEIKTPLVLFKIRYFQNENGIYYKKIGENHRRKVKPFWKKKRIILGIPAMLLLVLGVVGYKIGMNLASEKMVSELTSQMTKEDYDALLKEPSIQEIIDKEMGSDKKSELLNSVASDPAIKDAASNETVAANAAPNTEEVPAAVTTASGKDKTEEKKQAPVEKAKPQLQFKSSSEVLKFMLSKFSMSELNALAKKAEGGVTAGEKEEIKNTVLARLSPEEYNAVKVFAVIEASKRQ